ncbi:MAG: hypothetical protein IKI54_01780 [Lachnospiraceae bacterium]|nr:hypothetical protein [Lachnospiraceae bacterium]
MSEDQKSPQENMNTAGNIAPERLMLLVTVVQKGKGTFFADLLQTYDVNLQVSFTGTGTARQDLIEFLGLKDNRRTVLFSIVREEKLDAILEALESRFYSVNGKTGIAFAIPLSSVIGKMSYGFMSNDRQIATGEV